MRRLEKLYCNMQDTEKKLIMNQSENDADQVGLNTLLNYFCLIYQLLEGLFHILLSHS